MGTSKRVTLLGLKQIRLMESGGAADWTRHSQDLDPQPLPGLEVDVDGDQLEV